MRVRYHVAVRRPDDDAILVLRDGAMPGFTLDDAPWWQVVTPVVDRLRDDLALDVVALRAAWLGEPAADGSVDRLYEVAWRGGSVPAGSRWVPLPDLERRETPLGRAIDAGVLEPADGELHPWYRPHWFDPMAAWIDQALADAGLRRRGPVRQVRSWGRAALLVVDTDRGRVWAKQVPSVFAHEIAVTRLLGDVDPGFVAPEIAADRAAGRVLMEHVDGPLLTEQRDDIVPWTATLARLAEVQRVLAADLDGVRVAGLPAASLASLADDLPGAPRQRRRRSADPRRDPGPGDRLPRPRLDPVRPECRARGPVTGPGRRRRDGPGHPGLVRCDDHPPVPRGCLVPHRARRPARRCRRARRGLPGRLGGGHDARRALDLAMVVYPLHLVRLYATRILPGLEQPWEMEQMIPWGLDRLAPRLADLPRILGR